MNRLHLLLVYNGHYLVQIGPDCISLHKMLHTMMKLMTFSEMYNLTVDMLVQFLHSNVELNVHILVLVMNNVEYIMYEHK